MLTDVQKIVDGTHKWVATSEDEAEDLAEAIHRVFEGKTVRVNVEDDQSGDASQVSKLSEILDEDGEDGE